MPNRKGYAKLQAETRRQQSETLRAFKESNPEAYERLLKRAQEELTEETTTQPTIVFTGELSITRDKASQLAEAAGFKVSNHVSKNTTYVVVGENPGSKLQKAMQLDTEILTEEDFNALLKGQKPSRTKTTTCKACEYKLSEDMSRYAHIYGGFTCPRCHTVTRF